MVCVHSVINTYNTNLEYSCLCHKCVLGTTLIQQQVVFFVTYKFQNLEKGAFKSNVLRKQEHNYKDACTCNQHKHITLHIFMSTSYDCFTFPVLIPVIVSCFTMILCTYIFLCQFGLSKFQFPRLRDMIKRRHE